jgi:hypothetical protein
MQVIPVWRVLVSFSRSKFVSSSLLWVAVVPVIARITEGIDDTFVVHVGEKLHSFHLAVPFTWSLFFFGALFFLLGNLIVNWKAPRIIQETQTFRDFTEQGRSPTELDDLASHLKPSGKITSEKIQTVLNDLALIRTHMSGNLDGRGPQVGPVMGNALSAIYELTVNEAWNYYHRKSRLMAAISYAIGFLFYGFVLAQSTWFVLKHLLRTLGIL